MERKGFIFIPRDIMKETDPSFLKISVQRGLVGNVSRNLAGLYATLEHDRVGFSPISSTNQPQTTEKT
jgi:hypothetical protein